MMCREFIVGLGGAVAWPVVVRAQPWAATNAYCPLTPNHRWSARSSQPWTAVGSLSDDAD
jgi:hypothetical protein